MLRKDDILLTQPALWSKLKVYGKTIKYVQLLTPNLSSNVSVVPVANQVGSYITILEPSLVGHKVYVKITADDNRISLGWYKNENGVMGYDLITGNELNASSTPSATEGVYEITQDMVHSGTNYLQLYYFVYSGLPTGSHTITVQLVDLTELGMDNIINPVLFNATDLGKYMLNNTLNRGSGLISVESPLSCYKNGTLVRTLNLIKEGNHIKLNGLYKASSLLGKQNKLTQGEGNLYNWLTFDKNGWRYYTVAQTPYNIELNSSHTYLAVFYLNRIDLISSTFEVSNGNASNFSITSRQIVDKYAIAKMTNSSGGTLNCLRINNNGSLEGTIGKYVILIDLTALGLDNLTAQQFYDNYHDKFDMLANGQSVCLLSDTYTNYNGKYNKVLGEVDLGTLNWITANEYGETNCDNLAGIIKPISAPSIVFNAMCSKYESVSADNMYHSTTKDKMICQWQSAVSTGGRITISDDSFIGKTGAEIKTLLNNVKLIYELATPTTETLSSKMIPSGITEIIDKNGVGVEYKKQ